MTDSRTGMPTDRQGDSDKQGQGVQGMRGERTEDPGVAHPEQRRSVSTAAGELEVEVSSGTAFAEAEGAARMTPPDPDAKGGVEDNSVPVNASEHGVTDQPGSSGQG